MGLWKSVSFCKTLSLCTVKELCQPRGINNHPGLLFSCTKSTARVMNRLTHQKSLWHLQHQKPTLLNAKINFKFTEGQMMVLNRGKRGSKKMLKVDIHRKLNVWFLCYLSKQFMMKNLEIVRFGSKMKEMRTSGNNLKNNLTCVNKLQTSIQNSKMARLPNFIFARMKTIHSSQLPNNPSLLTNL